MEKIVFMALWVFVLGATQAQPGHIPIQKKILLDTSLYTIINYTLNEWIPFENVKPAALTRNEIENMEELVIEAVNKYNFYSKEKGFGLLPLEKYKRQYVAVLNKYGQKVAWINFLCSVQNKSWRKDIMVVQDGGPCYFNIKVNLSKKVTFELFVNSDS